MLRRIVFAATAALACSALAAGHAAADNRVALVIGQSAYRAVTPLPNPANDAKAMGQLLRDAGFDVIAASDLMQGELREKVGEFASRIAAKGPDTIAVLFYAGHGLQIDGENYLVPVDVDPRREADVPLQAVRLADVMNTLASVPSKMRIVMLDACRNNPFPDLTKTAGRGLAAVDARVGATGTFISYSTSPGAEAEDGTGASSPYTTALVSVAREPGLSIEDAFKRVRLAVNKTTEGRQTPWDSSSLTDGFSFFAGATPAVAAPRSEPATLAAWRAQLQSQQPDAAYTIVVADDSVAAYEAFVALFPKAPEAERVTRMLERRRQMLFWADTVAVNTASAYQTYLARYPDTDLSATAKKLLERARNRPEQLVWAGDGRSLSSAVPRPASAAPATAIPAAVTTAAPTCPCTDERPAATPPLRKKPEPPARRAEPEPGPAPAGKPRPPRRVIVEDEDEVVVRRSRPYVNRMIDEAVRQGYGGGYYGGSGYGGRYR